MFVYSIRASGIKFLGVLILTFAVLVAITLGGGAVAASAKDSSEVVFSGIKTEEDRLEFLASFGIKTGGGAIEEVAFVMPENFDRVMLGYNEIQKMQGLDLSRYAKKKVTRYTYEVINYPELQPEGAERFEGAVYANLLVYRNRIIGADLSSADPTGFVEGIVR